MKKILTLAFVISLISASSNAGELYVSPSILASKVSSSLQQQARVRSADKDEASVNVVNFGVEGGYRFEIFNFFFGPELYYYNYGASIKDYKNTVNASLSDEDEVLIQDTYGVALNLGYRFTEKFALYARGGLGSSNYKVTWYSGDGTAINKASTANAPSAMVSVGGWYDLTKNLALKLSYDRHSLDTKEVVGDVIDSVAGSTKADYFDVTIQSINMGLIFKF